MYFIVVFPIIQNERSMSGIKSVLVKVFQLLDLSDGVPFCLKQQEYITRSRPIVKIFLICHLSVTSPFFYQICLYLSSITAQDDFQSRFCDEYRAMMSPELKALPTLLSFSHAPPDDRRKCFLLVVTRTPLY